MNFFPTQVTQVTPMTNNIIMQNIVVILLSNWIIIQANLRRFLNWPVLNDQSVQSASGMIGQKN